MAEKSKKEIRYPLANKKSGKKPDVHVTPKGGQWAVMREGNERASSLHDTQAQAAEKGKEIARKDKTEFHLHDRQGQVRDRISYGNDPNPPKDTK